MKRIHLISIIILVTALAIFLYKTQSNKTEQAGTQGPAANLSEDPAALVPKIPKFMQVGGAVVTENSAHATADGFTAKYAFYVKGSNQLTVLKNAYKGNLVNQQWQVTEPDGNTILATKENKQLKIAFEDTSDQLNVSAEYSEKK
jgi:hypothetical protein